MSKKLKHSLVFVFILMILCAGAFGGFKAYTAIKVSNLKNNIFPITDDINTYEVKPMEACWLFDISDKQKMVGFADYVFVARIDEMVGTTYKDVVELEAGRITATPFTNYKIAVLQNIKGELSVNESIPFRKLGGVDYTQKYVTLFDDDSLLEVGKTYLIVAYASKDGDIYASGPNTTILISDKAETVKSNKAKANDKNEYSAVIDSYVEAYKNQEITIEPYERFVSVDDVAA